MGCGMSISHSSRVANLELPTKHSEEFEAEYAVSEVLGRGSFSTVWRATSTRYSKQGEDVALKMISKNRSNFRMKAIRRELNVVQKICHPGCVGLLDFFQVDEKIVMVQEVANGGDLHDRICRTGPLSSLDASFVLSQLLEAVGYLHKQGICHRDLKPENLFMMGNNPKAKDYWLVKIGDFGLSTDEANGYKDVMASVCGTPEFNAPEILRRAAGAKTKYSCKVDVWSLGAILYTMLSASQPFSFRRGDPQETLRRVCEGQYSFSSSAWLQVEKEAISAVTQMMNPSSEKRLTIAECKVLPWVAKWESRRMPQVEVADSPHSSPRNSDVLDTEFSFNISTSKHNFQVMPVDWECEIKQARNQEVLELLIADKANKTSRTLGA
mmetsp:Transcript_46701/g.73123  ORF Transcript_46701/g.73123 Transcript_46701/m.73123 type:complete len:382 (-) Transcript_46701:68-1213(-)|eukprot:CAMPEP_0184310758 /NCGR_PEP_ID=MMETSP1049-20130417/34585_1 /TAXON_ID=77928 /ORGANISM="Proteomonas sulcata, Strain CCMP704" /LENGTH=381 /DNA_ID=CAMNT_0026625373 /DNA_START=445 /DNA_END=1590 /DNA_ORIENTATION=-